MAVKVYKPTSPGRRGMTSPTFEEITKAKPERRLIVALRKSGGRDARGKISVRHRGGGSRRYLRLIDFKRDKLDLPAKVAAIEYDPNRSARIALLHYADGEKRYIIAPLDLRVGDTVVAGKNVDIRPGNAMPIANIPVGTMIHNIELQPGKGGQLARSNVKLGKAGRTRHLGIRPAVRGTAMSPRDHPHGGGEGRQPVGLPGPKSPWGKPTRGYKTRNNKKTDALIIKRRGKKRS